MEVRSLYVDTVLVPTLRPGDTTRQWSPLTAKSGRGTRAA